MCLFSNKIKMFWMKQIMKMKIFQFVVFKSIVQFFLFDCRTSPTIVICGTFLAYYPFAKVAIVYFNTIIIACPDRDL